MTATVPTTATPGARPSGRRRRFRLVAEVALILLVVAGLGWAADEVARVAARTVLVGAVQQATGVARAPEVRLGGGLLLPQALRGVYQEVEVDLGEVSSGPLRLARVDAELTGVRLPLRDVLLQDVRGFGVDHARQRATLTYADLDAYLEVTERPLRVAPVPPDALRVSGTVDVLGRGVTASALAELTAQDGSLVVRPARVETAAELDGPSRLLLEQRLTFTVPLQSLPFGDDLTGVEVGDREVQVQAEGRGVVLRP